MDTSRVRCPGCRTADYVRNVPDIHSAAAKFTTGNGGSAPYILLLAQVTALPEPPSPPVPPTLTPPPAPPPTLEHLARSRHHIPRFAAIASGATLCWVFGVHAYSELPGAFFVFAAMIAPVYWGVALMVQRKELARLRRHVLWCVAAASAAAVGWLAVQLAGHYFHRPVTGSEIFGALAGNFFAFAVFIAPVYWGAVLLAQRYRLRSLRGAWDAYNTSAGGAQNRLAAQRAAHAVALRRAQEAMVSAFYCHQCAGCFWPTSAITDIPERKVLTPDGFRAALARAGGYAGLASYYRQS